MAYAEDSKKYIRTSLLFEHIIDGKWVGRQEGGRCMRFV